MNMYNHDIHTILYPAFSYQIFISMLRIKIFAFSKIIHAHMYKDAQIGENTKVNHEKNG